MNVTLPFVKYIIYNIIYWCWVYVVVSVFMYLTIQHIDRRLANNKKISDLNRNFKSVEEEGERS